MDTHGQPDDFIAYPTQRVVGTIVDANVPLAEYLESLK